MQAKRLLNYELEVNCGAAVCGFTSVTTVTDRDMLVAKNAWLNSEVEYVFFKTLC